MVDPRWHKVLRDLWRNKARSLLVVLSIAVGVFSFGMIAGTREITLREMNNVYLDARPPSAMLVTSLFDDQFVDEIRALPGVKDASPRRKVVARLKTGVDEWHDIELYALPDFNDIRVAQVLPDMGAWPPPEHEILIERAALGLTQAQVGDSLRIETPRGETRALRVAGLATDYHLFPSHLSGRIYGYITFDTLDWLGEGRYSNVLYITVADNPLDRSHVLQVTNQVRDKFEESGRVVQQFWLPPTLGKAPAYDISAAVVLIMGMLSLLILLMSGFLVTSTVSALMAQQVRQTGVMKAIGGRSSQIAGMYVVMIAIFGLLAVAIGVPLAEAGARGLSDFVAGFIDFDITSYAISPTVVILQIGLGLLVPLLAGLFPVLSGARLTVREAIAGSGTGSPRPAAGRAQRLFDRLSSVPRPLLLSIRNTFRRKGRLVLALTTLTLASAIFISVYSVRASTVRTLDEAAAYYQYDVQVDLAVPRCTAAVQRAILSQPGITGVETWGQSNVHRVLGSGLDSDNIMLIAPPPATTLIRPTLVEGRWLLPDDTNALVVDSNLLRSESDIGLGDDITLKVEGSETVWHVVGLVRGQVGPPTAYVNYTTYAGLVRDGMRDTSTVRVITEQHDAAYQAAVVDVLKESFTDVGLNALSFKTAAQLRADSERQLSLIIMFLLMMAVLLALVGSIGLVGTMSINVLERRREIGIMRAIGATNGSIMGIVIAEGIVIGLIAWLLGSLLAIPLSRLMSDAVGVAFMKTPLSYTYSLTAVVLWMGVISLLATIGSMWPAWSAARLSVREVLAYE